MILIGQHERVVTVGPTEAHHCLRCQTETEFAPQLRYRMARIDLLFGFTYQRRYELACSRCGYGWVLDTDTMDQQLGGVPIPWRHRFGLPLMLVVVVGLALSGWLWRHGFIG
ncbi:hypothetical protein [Stenotrophomonas maltophilia]|uniref:Transmembrane protein n=1 Tax=Stenotrophomonas maltophilia (strain R551-3) TaxID=391008 RepID=B4SIZ1_STRM5|nr:hypothetical protein [Stenotrophomonas maltophilia]ACF53116.1 hypothetical protein Smal_3417 [Stenotrophomonas maltophilia R551-3]MBN5143890.1 hypothetical protein [Stenotrophomonas maltophilia]